MRAHGAGTALGLALVLAASACGSRGTVPPLSLSQVLGTYDQEARPYFPFTASEAGLRQYDSRLANDIGEEYRSGLRALCTRHRGDLRRVDRAALGEQDRLTYDIFAHRMDRCVEHLAMPWHLLPVNQAGRSWPSQFPVLGMGKGSHPFRTVRNYEDFLGRVDGFVVWVDTAIANMRVGAARRITQPRDVMLRVIPQLDAQIVEDPRTSAFYEPVKNFPSAFDEATRRALGDKYEAAIRQKIVPTYRKLRTFIQEEYLPQCRTSYGLGVLPGGREMYIQAVRDATTTSLTPAEIFEIGLGEVKRIRTEIDRVRAEMVAQGDAPPLRYRTVDELVQGYSGLRASVDAALPRLFGRVPRAGFEIRPIEAFRERSRPSSYNAASPDGSRPGVFYLNASELARPGATALVYRNLFLHEAVPGHHLQIALQRENTGLPGFRRFGWYTAFGEGWALYAEGLGEELGVYPTRRDRLDMLNGELFRAARLVVDVGLHERGWTKEQAIEYLGGRRENAEREVERYMVWPGQALGYKIGQLTIRALRARAEAALGAAFDVRAFHDELLRDGAMPLPILEAKMDRWIAAQRGKP
jgi:uncharacterized protein (DUF885 family)